MKKSIWKIPLSDIDITSAEEKATVKVLRSKWLSMGEVTQAFEEKFKKAHQAEHSIAVSNCSTALHLANLAIGVQKGDEVIVPSFTFVATANAAIHCGAKIVFADIVSDNNLTISVEDIEKKISRKTKAIIVVHYAGYPCDMGNIMKLAKKHNLYVIEDCAHSPLTKYKGKYLGTYGDASCFSFFANKNMTTAEGGMILAKNKNIAKKIKSLRSHGMTSLTLDRHKGHSYTYDVVDLGFNFRIDEIRSALGIEQLKKLPLLNRKRRRTVKIYRKRLENIKEISMPFEGFSLEESSCHIFPVLTANRQTRDGLQKYLKEKGIQTSIHYPPIHKFTYFKNKHKNEQLPITEDVSSRLITLPLFPSLKEIQIKNIAEKIKCYFKGRQ